MPLVTSAGSSSSGIIISGPRIAGCRRRAPRRQCTPTSLRGASNLLRNEKFSNSGLVQGTTAGNNLAPETAATLREHKRQVLIINARRMLQQQFGFRSDANDKYSNPIAASLWKQLTAEQSDEELKEMIETNYRNLQDALEFERTHPKEMKAILQRAQSNNVPFMSPSAIQGIWDIYSQLRELQNNLPSLPSAKMKEDELLWAIELWESLLEKLRPGVAAIPGLNFMLEHLEHQFDEKRQELAHEFEKYYAKKQMHDQGCEATQK